MRNPTKKPKTGERTSMPPRGDRPGHKIGRNNLRYWIAAQVVRDTKGFPFKCIPLPAAADNEAPEAWEDRLGEVCREHTAQLLAYLDNPLAVSEESSLQYDGTMRSACRIYRGHPHSPYHDVKKKNTQRYYDAYLDLIIATVGSRLVRKVDLFTVQHWYKEWRKPAESGGEERVDRAHDAVSMVRTVVNFCARLKFPGRKDCKELASDLKGVKFEKGGAREEEMTLGYARAFIRAAHDLGRGHKVPAYRARSLAIGVAAQFDLMLRQKDLIGEWVDKADNYRFPKGASLLDNGTEIWGGFFTWENIPAWRWRMKTSKSKYRSAADFDLTRYTLLFPLLEAVPHAERIGPIVTGEKGLPVRENTYRYDFRKIARAAGIPDAVWNMDSRAGGATEADEAGAALGDISGALTHTETKTTVRYLRRGSSKKIANVADARALNRAAGEKEDR